MATGSVQVGTMRSVLDGGGERGRGRCGVRQRSGRKSPRCEQFGIFDVTLRALWVLKIQQMFITFAPVILVNNLNQLIANQKPKTRLVVLLKVNLTAAMSSSSF